MRRLFATAALVLLQLGVTSGTTFAEKVDMSTVTCSLLIESMEAGSDNDKSGMGGILYWIAGYTVTDEQGSVVDFDALGKDFDKILASCRAQPKVGLLSVASKFLGENATEAGSGAADIATMTCQAAVNASSDDDDGLGLILMWIAGYQASDSEDPIFDADGFVADMQEVGEYCGDNPSVGLLTASGEIMDDDDE